MQLAPFALTVSETKYWYRYLFCEEPAGKQLTGEHQVMITTARTLKLLRVALPFTATLLATACGGGGSSGSTPSVMTYSISASAGTGGSVSPSSATVNAGGATTFSVTPNSGFGIGSVTGCGGSLSGSTYTTGTISANCAVTATFVAQYAVTATAAAGGALSPASATVNAGGTTTLTVTPNSGYVVSGVTGCGGNLAGTTYTTGPINAACTVTASFAATFTWVSGSSTADASTVYGVQGVAAASNVPGARDGGVTWTDTNGNLWMFGGFMGYSAQHPTVGDFSNELWKYSPASGQWTWVGGSSTPCAAGVYGNQGVAAAANVPAARNAIRWTDASGNFWMYGGGGCAPSTDTFILYADLWKYSPASGQWTWVGGSNSTSGSVPPVYGTKNVAATANTPGVRVGAVAWTDTNGNVLMFGGFSGNLNNDLWEYLPANNEWAWIGGANVVNQKGVYGVMGVADSANVPGARSGAASWVDSQGNLWMFGGFGYDFTGGISAYLNDLWKYSSSSGQWTWVGGADAASATGVYGTQGVAAASNVPGARTTAISWMDASGNLWLLGGEAPDITTNSIRHLNDLWKYSPSSGQWTWVAGSSTFDATGVYGTQGVAATTNVPGARAAVVSWTSGGSAWLFGGFQIDDSSHTRFEMNDLWKYPIQ